MAVLQKSISVWLLTAVLCGLALVKLEGKSTMDWSVVFLPLWILNCILLSNGILIIAHLLKFPLEDYRRRVLNRKIGLIVGVILKFVFEILLCLKLQFFHNLPLFFAMIPLWILLALIIHSLVQHLITSES